METAKLTEILPTKSLEVRPITVIKNTLNAFRAVHNVRNSPLLNLVLNPLSGQLPLQFSAKDIQYKGYVSESNNLLINTLC